MTQISKIDHNDAEAQVTEMYYMGGGLVGMTVHIGCTDMGDHAPLGLEHFVSFYSILYVLRFFSNVICL